MYIYEEVINRNTGTYDFMKSVTESIKDPNETSLIVSGDGASLAAESFISSSIKIADLTRQI